MRALALTLTALLGLAGCEACDDSKPESNPPAAQPATPRASGSSVDPQTAARQPQTARGPGTGPTLPTVPDSPLSKEQLSTCMVDEAVLDRIACMGSLAQRHRDPRYCDAIAEQAAAAGKDAPEMVRSGTAAHACLRTIAFMRDDAELCKKIGQPAMAGSCLSYFAMKRRDPTVCGQAQNEASRTCYLNEAARTRDPSLCEKTGSFREDCVKRLGPASP